MVVTIKKIGMGKTYQVTKEDSVLNSAIKPAFAENNLGLVLSADKNYVPYLAVTLQSIFDNAAAGYNYDILIFDDGITDCQKSLLKDMAKKNCSVRYINVKELLKEIDTTLFQARGIWSVATFYRLFIPKIMKSYDKVLYLDCDVLVKDSLVDLLHLDLADKQIAAVPDYMTFSPKLEKVKRHMDEIGVKDYRKYFNAGVVLFRPDKIDYERFKESFLNILRNKKLSFLDQDVLNIIFENRSCLIDLGWNYQYNLLHDYPELQKDKDLALTETQARIIHYTSSYKPWSYPDYPHAAEWWMTARRTPFYEEIIYKNTRTSNILLRNLVCRWRLIGRFMLLKLLRVITFGRTNRKIDKSYNEIKKQVSSVKRVLN